MRTALLVALAASLTLAGCIDGSEWRPADEVEETGREIRLKASVIDWKDHTVYPEMKANLWAFCFEPLDPNDAASAAAIEGWSRLESDAMGSSADERAACGVPGPTIRVQQGDRVTVVFGHSHFHRHTIHWHGQYVSTENDGAPGVSQEATPSGGETTYTFIAKKAGTLWYHCHVDTQLHVMQGLYGMFIVEPADREHEEEVDAEYKMVLGTLVRGMVDATFPLHAHGAGCTVSGTPDCKNPPLDMDPDVFLINGRSLPLTMDDPDTLYKIREGGKIRIRILNAGNTVETIHPHGQDMKVTHRDGNPLPAPFWVDTLTIGPAERYDVIIEGTNPGAWMMHTHVADHETNDGQAPGGMHTMLVYEGFEDKMHAHRAELFGGLPYMDPVPLPSDRTFVATMHLGSGAGLPVDIPGAPAPAAIVLKEWSFPVELACAARSATVTASLTGTAATAQLSSLEVTIVDGTDTQRTADGELVLGTPASNPQAMPTTSVTWTAVQEQGNQGQLVGLPAGNITVRVSGTAVEANVHLAATLDYFGSYDEMKLSHKLHKTPLCGLYGNGNDGNGGLVPAP